MKGESILQLFFYCLLVTFAGCATCPNTDTVDVPNKNLIWLSNTSRVSFEDILKLNTDDHPEIEELEMFEGFYEEAKIGKLPYSVNEKEGECLSPEAEWVFYYPEPAQLVEALRTGEWGNVKVYLTGMIEGKRLDVLNRTLKCPVWISASGGNNVIAQPRETEPLLLSELEKVLDKKNRSVFASMAVFCVDKNGKLGEEPLYTSTTDDLKENLLNKIPSRPVYSITKAVMDELIEQKSADSDKAQLVAINLGAQGQKAALVNNCSKTMLAGCKALFSYKKLPGNIATRGMYYITKSALKDRKENCLSSGDSYKVIVYRGVEKEEKIGEGMLGP